MVKPRNNQADPGKTEKAERLSSLDAARGVFLLLLLSGGFGLKQMLPDARWNWVTDQWAPREWQGCTLWDMLQPALLFFVGVAMPYSYANRLANGQGWFRQFAHALLRAVLLIAIGIYLDSYRAGRLLFEVRGDLQLIGMAYLLAFLVVPLGMAAQGVSVGFLLVGHTAGHVIHALTGGHELWSKTQNVGVAIDQWLRLPAHAEHLVTFNIVPAAAIILLGALVAGLIRSGPSAGVKVFILTACSFVGILSGWLLSGGNGWIEFRWFAVMPMIHRLITWTFVLTSVGWTLLLFTYFYLVMDGLTLRAWAIPLSLIGRNPLFLFVTWFLFRDWAARSASLVLPSAPPILADLRPLFVSLIVIAIFWLLCFWLYRRRIFFKV